MMDDHYAPRPVAAWFMVGAVAALLFMSFGCVTYLMHLFADPSAMPIDQRTAHDAEPLWVKAANGMAVALGLAGAVMLVMKRKLAEPMLLACFVVTLLWLIGLVAVTGLRENMTANDLIVALVVTALCWTIYWFARHSRQRGWLR